jgi:hypothetical protein
VTLRIVYAVAAAEDMPDLLKFNPNGPARKRR